MTSLRHCGGSCVEASERLERKQDDMHGDMLLLTGCGWICWLSGLACAVLLERKHALPNHSWKHPCKCKTWRLVCTGLHEKGSLYVLVLDVLDVTTTGIVLLSTMPLGMVRSYSQCRAQSVHRPEGLCNSLWWGCCRRVQDT